MHVLVIIKWSLGFKFVCNVCQHLLPRDPAWILSQMQLFLLSRMQYDTRIPLPQQLILLAATRMKAATVNQIPYCKVTWGIHSIKLPNWPKWSLRIRRELELALPCLSVVEVITTMRTASESHHPRGCNDHRSQRLSATLTRARTKHWWNASREKQKNKKKTNTPFIECHDFTSHGSVHANSHRCNVAACTIWEVLAAVTKFPWNTPSFGFLDLQTERREWGTREE